MSDLTQNICFTLGHPYNHFEHLGLGPFLGGVSFLLLVFFVVVVVVVVVVVAVVFAVQLLL